MVDTAHVMPDGVMQLIKQDGRHPFRLADGERQNRVLCRLPQRIHPPVVRLRTSIDFSKIQRFHAMLFQNFFRAADRAEIHPAVSQSVRRHVSTAWMQRHAVEQIPAALLGDFLLKVRIRSCESLAYQIDLQAIAPPFIDLPNP